MKNPTVKYTLARAGLFAAAMLLLWPVPLNVFVKLMVALLASAVLSYFLLRRLRDEVAGQWGTAGQRRRAERDRLRAALAGTDEGTGESTAGTTGESAGGRPAGTPADRPSSSEE